MGTLILTLVVVVIIIVATESMKSKLGKRIDRLSDRVENLTQEVKKSSHGALKQTFKPNVNTDDVNLTKEPPVEKKKKTLDQQFDNRSCEISQSLDNQKVDSNVSKKRAKEEKPEPTIINVEPQGAIKEGKVKKPSFSQKYPDLEKFIGENLVNKIGIAILVIGIGFFVKHAIDMGWLNEVGRTIIGLLSGAVLLLFAHQLKNKYKAFSSVLMGGGIGTFYFTIGVAFREYALFSQTAAFLLMVAVTLFSILMSIWYDKKELAILSILGGFASPLIASSGSGNFVVLFSYLIILNLGMLTLAYFKRWNVVNLVSYICTYLMFGAWFMRDVLNVQDAPNIEAMVFGGAFFLIFFLSNIVNNVKKQIKFNALELSLLLSNTFIYFSVGLLALDTMMNGQLKGIFTAAMALFNFGFAYVFYRTKSVDKNLVYLLIGLVLTFLSLVGPIQLSGNHITLFWAAEAVLLLWLANKSGIKIIKLGSGVVNVLLLISLIWDWQQVYNLGQDSTLTILLNKGFVTSIATVISLFLTTKLLKGRRDVTSVLDNLWYPKISRIVGVVVLFLGGYLELNYQLHQFVNLRETRVLVLFTYVMTYLVGLMLLERKFEYATIKLLLSLAATLGIVIYVLGGNLSIVEIRNAFLVGEALIGGFAFHYALLLILGMLLVLIHGNVKRLNFESFDARRALLWFTCIVSVFVVSAELDHIIVLLNYLPGKSIEYIISQNQKIGYPIIWGISSFVFMWIGMRKDKRELRIMSLSLFALILIKLFLFDIREVSQGGKIAAFISLGVILLVVSFMYQRLKRLILDESLTKKTTEQ